ncbi:MAG: hypothetical protein Q8904_04155 [Bacteroidota bacterium]|nr:hypothetical protein [Bacteroidota bacterium]
MILFSSFFRLTSTGAKCTSVLGIVWNRRDIGGGWGEACRLLHLSRILSVWFVLCLLLVRPRTKGGRTGWTIKTRTGTPPGARCSKQEE